MEENSKIHDIPMNAYSTLATEVWSMAVVEANY